MKVKNAQAITSRNSWFVGVIFAIICILPFIDYNPLSGIWAIAFVGFFAFVTSISIAIIFGKRAAKMNKLINGSELLFEWKLDDKMLQEYVSEQFRLNITRNKGLMIPVSILFAIITIIFLFMLDSESRLPFFGLMGGIYVIVLLSSLLFPQYYRISNLKGDKTVLIGKKYAYINGYFHNWDFTLSGIKKVKATEEPFKGIIIGYYYSDRTGRHLHELKIPVNDNIDRDELIKKLLSKK